VTETVLQAPGAIGRVIGTVLEELLEAFAGLTEDPLKIYGPKDNKLNNPAPPCIAWMPGHEQFTPGQRQGKPGQPAALFTREVAVQFEIFGGKNHKADPNEDEDGPPSTSMDETDRTETIMTMLVNSLHRQLSHHGYQIIDGGWGHSTRTGLGMAYLLNVTIRLPLAREDNQVVHLTAVNYDVEIDNG